MANPVIKVNNLVKEYKKSETRAVDDISFSVEQGEFFAFLGPNGAGKTTTISILTTTLSKTSGEVIVAGHEIEAEASTIRSKIGIIFQKPSLDENLTAEENIRLHAVMYGLHPFAPTKSMMGKEYNTQVHQLAEVLSLENDLDKPVKSFSGGMKRKLEIVRSLMHNPEILFLDEPTTGLDPESRANLWSYLQTVRKERNTTIFLTTHYLDEVEGADRVAIISKGKIIENAPPAELKDKLVDEYLELTAENFNQMTSEVSEAGYEYQESDKPKTIKISLNSNSVQKIINSLNIEVDRINIHRPTLEQAYLKVVETEANKDETDVD